jgi:hypothetical protein
VRRREAEEHSAALRQAQGLEPAVGGSGGSLTPTSSYGGNLSTILLRM